MANVVASNGYYYYSFGMADIDSDGDQDFFGDNQWYRNDGGGDYTTSTLPFFHSNSHDQCRYAIDLDGQPGLEFLSIDLSGFQNLAWAKAPLAETSTAQMLHYKISGAFREIAPGDVDMDGDQDVILLRRVAMNGFTSRMMGMAILTVQLHFQPSSKMLK